MIRKTPVLQFQALKPKGMEYPCLLGLKLLVQASATRFCYSIFEALHKSCKGLIREGPGKFRASKT